MEFIRVQTQNIEDYRVAFFNIEEHYGWLSVEAVLFLLYYEVNEFQYGLSKKGLDLYTLVAYVSECLLSHSLASH